MKYKNLQINFLSVSVIAVITLGLYLSSFYSYLLFHNLIEIISISIAFTLFILTWNSHSLQKNDSLKLPGIAYAFIAIIDLLHILAYKGMDIFPGFGANLPAQLWISARYMQSLTLLTVPFFVERRLNSSFIIGVYSALISALLFIIYSGYFPDCYVEGKGLTLFKISSEYIITVILLISLYLIYRKRSHFNKRVFYLVASSIVCTAISEISFIAYISAYGFSNMVGHFFKLTAFYLIYKAIVLTGLNDPFDPILSDLKGVDDTLEKKVRDRAAELIAGEVRYEQSLLRLSRRLEHAQNYDEALNAAYDEVRAAIGYQHLWVYLFSEEKNSARLLLAGGGIAEILNSERGAPVLSIKGDRMLEEIADSKDIIVVEDARTDDRTDKEIVNRLGNRTIINVPIVLMDRHLGSVGTGSFGDEGVRVPTKREQEYLTALSSHMAVTLDRIHLFSERTLAELELARANRILRMLSDSNQALIRITDEEVLLNEICRIAVDIGGYRMAWVGYSENDEEKTLRSVAYAGFESGYIESRKLSWADNELGRGPGGTAVRTGVPCLVRNINIDPSFAPWREEAVKRGYQTVIALPLINEGEPFGALSIYSGEADVFEEKEVEILNELSGDLAFGITALRAQKNHILSEEALKKSEAFIKNILETVDEEFVVLDRNYRILSANKAFCTAAGLNSEDVLGHFCYEISHKSDKPCYEKGMSCASRKTFETGTASSVSQIYTDRFGAKKYAEIGAYPVTDNTGDVVSVIETIRDVTEKKKLEEQLLHAQKLEALGTLAGGVAHDFNNILSVMSGYTSMIEMSMLKDDPNLSYIQEVRNAVGRASRLTQSLLVFSRKQITEFKTYNINDLVTGMKKMLLRIIGEDIEVKINLCGETLSVLADYGQLEQVLMNFAINARDAMPDGGKLILETKRVDINEEFIHIHGYGKPGSYAFMSVSDSGSGMDEQTRGRIFEPFFTTKETGKGTGLGLSIVYGIVQQHSGYINCISEPGKGTTFDVLIPLNSGAADEKHILIPASIKRGMETILLADDDENVRKMTKELLEKFGYTVIEARDGLDALDKFILNSKIISLVLLDVIMPGKSGKDVYEDICRINPEIKVIFTSGYTGDIIQRKLINEEHLKLLQKPVPLDVLLGEIREILD